MIDVEENDEAVALAAAHLLVEKLSKKSPHKLSLVLSGGRTPKRTFEILATDAFKNKIDWSRVHVFWGDERGVPATDSRSNFKMAQEALLSHVKIPAAQIYPMTSRKGPFEDALDYELTLRDFFDDSPPSFDFVFLGLGTDGHTASLFPNTVALEEKTRWVTYLKNPGDDFFRFSLTPQILNLSQTIVFLATGLEKKQILSEILKPDAPQIYPAQLIQTQGELIWIIDEAAAPDFVR